MKEFPLQMDKRQAWPTTVEVRHRKGGHFSETAWETVDLLLLGFQGFSGLVDVAAAGPSITVHVVVHDGNGQTRGLSPWFRSPPSMDL